MWLDKKRVYRHPYLFPFESGTAVDINLGQLKGPGMMVSN